MARTRAWILAQLQAERGRWLLWLPVALGLGIAIYYELPVEPAAWLGPALLRLQCSANAGAGVLAPSVAPGCTAAGARLEAVVTC